ncbi:ABC transporter permease [Ekhidna sp.]
MNNHPPKYFLRFFRWFCHPRLQKPIEGDLMELYEERVKELGPKKANRLFGKDVLLLFRKDIIRPSGGTYRLTNYGMFKNYFKTTIRSLTRQKLYAAINIGGLSLSIACVLLILSFIQYEFSYDRNFENHDKIYRVYNSPTGSDFLGKNINAITPLQLASALESECPEVNSATVFDWYKTLIGKSEDNLYYESGIFSDKHFFHVFPHDFVAGDSQTALEDPTSLVLTESLARKIFNHENAMGQQLIHGDQVYQVTGVIKDPPKNTSFPLEFVMNAEGENWYKESMNREKWRSNGYNTFFTLNEGSDLSLLESKMPKLLEKYWINLELYPQQYRFEALKDVHLQSEFNFDFAGKGSKKQLLLFSTIVLLILILALVNYTNLAVARSMSRSKEVGLRKTVGAGRGQLIFQFLFESTFLTFIAMIVALLITSVSLPIFGELLERPLQLEMEALVTAAPYLLGLVFFLGILSGYYPAFLTSRLQPINALKGKTKGLTKSRLQKWLIVGQYAVSIAMIICAIEANQQFQFIQDKDLGFQKENILTLRNRSREVTDNFEVLKSQWLNHPNILAVAGSQNLPINLRQGTVVNDDQGGDPNDDLHIYQMRAGYDFLDLYDIELLAGRGFSRELNDSLNLCIINETTAKAMGWTPNEAVGKRFTEDWDLKYREVIGVIKDFHMHSMHMEIEPMFIERRSARSFRYISLEIKPENLQETIAYLEETIKPYSSYPFDARLLSDRYDQLYAEDISQSKIFNFFTLLAIVIASLGLFGLATYTIHLRVKEVGIRKVLGASISSIVSLVSLDFLKLVGLGFLIAIPLAWMAVEEWLEDFSYHIAIQWWVFALSGIIAVIIACLTISAQSIKIALSDPAEILKDE